ncbi:phage major capsid protein [Rhodobacter maris]|uniref:Mu-like prophage major head subunit gpT n=1 Tax=Rhodobacter maris TaxID=446682 RepID=A0A285S5G4_9RHOB|nr:Mu-like prophage major head subunit gpT family protein [Rhodobacter maris]SOC02155.1 Mu-like prophage major head subunit gpT [Rhodobacter maris]
MLDKHTTGAAQPTARHLAQMRLAASKAGLPPDQADLMAAHGVSLAAADATAQGLAQVAQMAAPFLHSGRLDAAAMLRISKHALRAGSGIEDPAQIAQAIAKAAGEEAAAIMAANEPNGRTAAPDLARGTASMVSARAGGSPSLADCMADGLLARMMAGHVPTHGREFAQMRLEDLARFESGASRRGARQFMSGLHVSDDFPIALGIASNQLLLNAYVASEGQLKRASREVTASDFRPINTVQVSNGMGLDKVNEAGEFTRGTIAEAGEAFAVETYGKVFALTRQAFVNDDLGVLSNAARLQGTGAALTEAKLFASLLEKNAGLGPTMQDGKTLFHADHGNLAAIGAAPNVTSLTVARTALRRQKGLSGEAIQVQPAFLIVPPELETAAQQLVAAITAASVDQVNPFSEKLEVLVDANLTNAKRWYLSAAPGVPDGMLHAYLDGAKGPQIFTREGFDVDSMEFKVRLDFGCGFADHRAWFMNPGE